MLRLVSCVFALLFGLPAVSLSAEERWAGLADTPFHRVPTEAGVPNALGPTAMVQEADGFLWISTQSGLVRWDGYRFRFFRPSLTAQDSLPDGVVQVLHRDRRGKVWIGTPSRGLAGYEPAHDRFVSVGPGADGLSHAGVNAIADAADGGLWIGTDGGLDHLDPKTGLVAHRRVDGATDPGVDTLIVDRRGRVRVGGVDGLFRGDVQGARFEAVGSLRHGPRSISHLFESSLMGANRMPPSGRCTQWPMPRSTAPRRRAGERGASTRPRMRRHLPDRPKARLRLCRGGHSTMKARCAFWVDVLQDVCPIARPFPRRCWAIARAPYAASARWGEWIFRMSRP